MKIERMRFLVLTAAIATAAACTTTASTPVAPSDDAGASDDAGTPSVGDSAIGIIVTPDSGAFTPPAACLGTTGSTALCTPFAQGGSGDSGTGSCVTASLCSLTTANATGGVAASILACEAADTSSTCAELGSCTLSALGNACSDATTTATCATILTTCGADAGVVTPDGGIAVTGTSCEEFIAGLSTGGRTQFAGCMTAAGNCDLVLCAESLFH